MIATARPGEATNLVKRLGADHVLDHTTDLEATRAHRRRRCDYLRSLVLPRFGAQPIGKMQPSDIDGWIADLMADGYAPRTIQRAWQIVLGVCRLAVRDRMILISPAREVTLPKVVRVEPVVFTVEEVMRLADAIDPRYRALVLIGAFGGLRIGELGGLQLGDFDPLRNQIRVRRAAADVAGQVIVGPPKTAKSIRTVGRRDSGDSRIVRGSRVSTAHRPHPPPRSHLRLPERPGRL